MNYSYKEPEYHVKEFFEHSLNGTLHEFDFEAAFKQMKWTVEQKLSEHGLFGFERFYENEKELRWELYNTIKTSMDRSGTGWIQFDGEQLAEDFFRGIYKQMKETFEGMSAYGDLQEILDGIEKGDFNNISGMTVLFDQLIHAQHVTGDIWEFDPDEIREDVESELQFT